MHPTALNYLSYQRGLKSKFFISLFTEWSFNVSRLSRLAITPDTKIPNCCTFTVEKEDHTLGNILCRYRIIDNFHFSMLISLSRHIQKQKGVIFAGYKMPHPLEHKFVLKVQTEKPLTPAQALERTVDHLISDLSILEERLKVSFARCCLHYLPTCLFVRLLVNLVGRN